MVAKIIALNGSPKGSNGTTIQFAKYIQRKYPEREIKIFHIAQKLKYYENNMDTFQELIDEIQSSEGIIWAFPLYVLHVHSNYKRFIELIWERGVENAFKGKYAITISTSIHFYDHMAHNYMQGIIDDLDMKYFGYYSPYMLDINDFEKRRNFIKFIDNFFDGINKKVPTPKKFAPLKYREFEYNPGENFKVIETKGKKILIVTDSVDEKKNIGKMVIAMKNCFSEAEIANIWDVNITGHCLGCLKGGYNNECHYLEVKGDNFIEFYKNKVMSADILIFAGVMKDRFFSSRWKFFFDRAFFNTHTPVLVGKQLGFIISGPLSQDMNFREFLESWTEFQEANLVGVITDEFGTSNEIDSLLQSFADKLIKFADNGYVNYTFRHEGGFKLFRDEIHANLRIVFRADHRYYKKYGLYDTLPNKVSLIWKVARGFLMLFLKMKKFRKKFYAMIPTSPPKRIWKKIEKQEPELVLNT